MLKKTILLVEDNADDEVLAIRALKKHGLRHEVRVARSGEEAMEQLFDDTNSGSFPAKRLDLVLLDLKLPKMSGFEVLSEIRSRKKTRFLPVIVLTTSKERKDILESYRRGANSYIQKPVDYEQFSNSVKLLGDYWLKLNQGPPE